MITKDDLIERANVDNEKRLNNIRAIHQYFDSVLVPLYKRNWAVHIWADVYEINISLAGSASDLTDFFRVMRQSGFTPDERPEAGEAVYNTRFRHEDGAVFYLAFTSTVCRRVQTGTVMVETPVYETVCGDEPASVMVESAPEMEDVL